MAAWAAALKGGSGEPAATAIRLRHAAPSRSYTRRVREKLTNWGLPGALGAAGYGLHIAAGLPDWAGFPMILLGAVTGSVLITVSRLRARRPPGGRSARL
jgi:hypothetical protein